MYEELSLGWQVTKEKFYVKCFVLFYIVHVYGWHLKLQLSYKYNKKTERIKLEIILCANNTMARCTVVKQLCGQRKII